MAWMANISKQKTYSGVLLLILALALLAGDLSFLAKPLGDLLASSRGGVLGFLPAAGMCLLNATHAIAFHEIGYTALILRILVLFCAMVSLISGFALLRPEPMRVQIIELALSREFEDREMINGSR